MTTSPDARPLSDEAVRKLILSAKLLQQNAEGCAVNHHGHDHELHGLPGWLADTQRDIEAAAAALPHMRPAAEPVAIRALEWAQDGDTLVANSIVGRHQVFENDGQIWWSIGHLWFGDNATLEAAKAAAQADYEARIRSALVASPAPAVTEPVAILLSADPYDERDGPWFSQEDLKKLASLPSGTKLYASPPASPADDRLRDVVEALEAAHPHLETLHSVTGGEGRKIVWAVIKRVRAALVSLREREG